MLKEKMDKKGKKDPSAGSGFKEKSSSFELEEEEWDKTKIGVGIVVGLLLLVGVIVAQKFFLPQLGIFPRQSVKGAATAAVASTPERISIPKPQDVQQKIGEIQDQITHLNVAEIASSSPQVQQLLYQIQQLPKIPGNAAKAACIQVCNRL